MQTVFWLYIITFGPICETVSRKTLLLENPILYIYIYIIYIYIYIYINCGHFIKTADKCSQQKMQCHGTSDIINVTMRTTINVHKVEVVVKVWNHSIANRAASVTNVQFNQSERNANISQQIGEQIFRNKNYLHNLNLYVSE